MSETYLILLMFSERYKVALSSCMQNNLVPYLHEINLSDDDDVDRFYHHQMMQFAVDIIDALCFLHRQQVRLFPYVCG